MFETTQEVTKQNFEWLSIIPSLLGTVVGGLITLSALWIKEKFDKQNTLQAWYEKTYIENGLDCVIIFTELIAIHLKTKVSDATKGLETKITYPVEAFVKTDTLLRSNETYAVPIVFSHYLTLSKTELNKLPEPFRKHQLELIQQVIIHLNLIRKDLLDIKINKKSDIYNISNLPNIRSLVNNLEEKNNKLIIPEVTEQHLQAE